MKKKMRKGFTMVELVMTIAILGVSTALTTLVIVNVTNIQKSSTDQYVYSKQLKAIDDVSNEYVSLVSLHNDVVSFDYVSQTSSSLVFRHDTNLFTLSYNSHSYGFSSDYSGTDDYFKKSRNEIVDSVDNVVFSYNVPLGQLNLTVTIKGIENHLSYIFRGAQ